MNLIVANISTILETPAGVFIAVLLSIDLLAFLGGISLVVVFRLRLRFRSNVKAVRISQAKESLEKYLAGDVQSGDDAAVLLSVLPPDDMASIFLEYSRLIEGESLELIIELFRGAGLTEWVLKAAHSHRWWKRMWVARLVELLQPEQAEALILKLISDRHPIVRMNAIQVAYNYPTEAVVQAMFELMEREDDVAHSMLKDTLIRVGAVISEPLKEFLSDRSHGEKCFVAAIDVAGAIKDPSFKEILLNIMREETGEPQAAAARALSSCPDEETVGELVNALNAEYDGARAMAIFSLGKIGDPQAVKHLVSAFPDKSWMVRYHCAAALHNLGEEGIAALKRCKNHSDRYVSEMAAHMLDVQWTAEAWET